MIINTYKRTYFLLLLILLVMTVSSCSSPKDAAKDVRLPNTNMVSPTPFSFDIDGSQQGTAVEEENPASADNSLESIEDDLNEFDLQVDEDLGL